MEQKIVPTSPKATLGESDTSGRSNEPARHLWLTLVLITLVLGTGAGIFGFLISTTIPPETPLIGQLNVVSVLEQERQEVLLSIRRPENSIVSQAPSVVKQIGAVYLSPPNLEGGGDFIGNALSLTSDGWMVMPTAAFDLLPFGEIEDSEGTFGGVVLLDDGASAAILDRLDDVSTGLTFFQVDASDLAVVSFAVNPPALGQSVSTIDKRLSAYTVYERRVSGQQRVGNEIRSTTDLNHVTVLDPSSGVDMVGLPVFHNSGSVLGIMRDDSSIVSAAVISSALQDIIQYGEIRRPTFDVRYVNLARVADEEKELAGLPDGGYYVSVAPVNSELQAGDVITAVNGVSVGASADFGFEILSRRQGSLLLLTVLRDEVEVSVEVQL